MKIKSEEHSKCSKASLVIAFFLLIMAICFFYWIVIRTPRAEAWCRNWAGDYFQELSKEKFQYRYNGCMATRRLDNELRSLYWGLRDKGFSRIDWLDMNFWRN